jgi:short subunit dehydrogenase-like uncharacterized protein
MMTTRDYDVVLYGAGGFTGRQTVAYFARHAPEGLRWALAGRHRGKLEAVRDACGERARTADILIADSAQQDTVDAVVARARIVLNTAGPFALYGTPVVDACVRFETHYVDITGETPWVHELIARYHDRAAASGTRIIPCCGFDSVPSDLGTLLMVRHVQQTFGAPCVEVRGYFQLSGGLNGKPSGAGHCGRRASIRSSEVGLAHFSWRRSTPASCVAAPRFTPSGWTRMDPSSSIRRP